MRFATSRYPWRKGWGMRTSRIGTTHATQLNSSIAYYECHSSADIPTQPMDHHSCHIHMNHMGASSRLDLNAFETHSTKPPSQQQAKSRCFVNNLLTERPATSCVYPVYCHSCPIDADLSLASRLLSALSHHERAGALGLLGGFLRKAN